MSAVSAVSTATAATAPPAVADWRTYPWDSVRWRSELPSGALEGVDIPGPPGPPFLLIHGLAGQWQHWLATLLPLARSRRVVALDLPGCGRSDPLPGPPSVERYAQSVLELTQARGITSAALVGHSFGGLVATAVAVAEPALAARLVVASVPALRRGALAELAPFALTGAAAAFKQLGSRYAPLVSRPRIRRAILRGAVADPRSVPADLAYLGYLSAPMASLAEIPRAALDFAGAPFARSAAQVRCPVTVVWGERDRIVPVSDADVVARRLGADRIVRIAGAGHLLMAEQPDAFCAALFPMRDGA